MMTASGLPLRVITTRPRGLTDLVQHGRQTAPSHRANGIVVMTRMISQQLVAPPLGSLRSSHQAVAGAGGLHLTREARRRATAGADQAGLTIEVAVPFGAVRARMSARVLK
jgi:hypothetical protein